MRYLLLLFCCLVFSQEKINGISFVASNNLVNANEVKHVINVNANWVTLMPFAFMKTINETEVKYNAKRQWIGERVEGIKTTTKLFKDNKIKVMIKPQIWIPNGFTGNIEMKNNEEWLLFENSYEKFILEYAQVSQDSNAEMFCIGTELKLFVEKRPSFFINLIEKTRKIYKGKITYAENWDCYDKVTFWNLLDYIGIDAYFELNNGETPKIKDLAKAWLPYKNQIEALAKKTNKQVVFTEFGYQSKNFTAHKPWSYAEKTPVNLKAQSHALAVLLETFWREKWFSGGFLWKWYDDYEKSGGEENTDYTVQNKPAEAVLRKIYNKYK
jgi:hypothetical protein